MTDNYQPDVNDEAWDETEEEICPQEVESVIHRLDQILETVESDTIHALLTEAYERIEELVDWEDDSDEQPAEAA